MVTLSIIKNLTFCGNLELVRLKNRLINISLFRNIHSSELMIVRTMFRAYEIRSLLCKRNFYTSVPTWKDKADQNKESKLQGYIMTSYLKYMNHYEQMLEKRFPSAMQVYRVFTSGIKYFYQDFKTFFKVRLQVLSMSKEDGFSSLKRREIELYQQMPKDMLKIAPVLILSAAPFANYVVFPIAYMYPQKFLTSHFWTPTQKEQFQATILSHRLEANKTLLKYLKTRSKIIKNEDVKSKWEKVLLTLDEGIPPSIQQLIECKSLFSEGPYSVANMQFKHAVNLHRLHGLTMWFSMTSKLYERAFLLKEMDKAILREGGVRNMSLADLKVACFMRGLHTSNMTSNDIINWLEKWVLLSNTIQKDSYSLLLHSSFLFGNNNQINIPKTKSLET